jgi:iduronate 2-sulfatase
MKYLLPVLALFIANIAFAADPKPNILLICIDDLKPVLGCYGDKLVKSPNIDRLAARGVRFDAAYCNQAVCSPSRNALLVGLRSQTLGIYDLGTNFRKSRPDAVTMPQYFKQHGYRAEAMGKIFHVGHGNNEDATSWSVPHFQAKSIQYVLKENNATPTREGALFENKNPANLPKGAAYESADVEDSTYGDGKIADEAIKRLQAAKDRKDQPFFMAVGFVKPHLPFCAPKKYWDLYEAKQFKLAEVKTPPAKAPSYAPQFGGELRNYKDMPAQGAIPDDVQRTLIHGYYAATSYMDAQLGRVLNALEETGLANNTIVVVWGDHGWHLGDHGIWCKHTNYEQAARIPFLVALPGQTKGSVTSNLVESVDVYPTLCELAGLPAAKALDGQSFATTLREPTAPTKEAIIHVYPRGNRLGRAVRTSRHRLVEWKTIGAAPENAEFELYDYEKDPLETANVATEQPEVVAQLRAILAKHPEAKPQIKAPAADAKQAAKPKQTRTELFTRKDKNGDGKLSREEFLASQPDPEEAPKRFVAFDTDKDGNLTKNEFVTQGGKNPDAK